MGMKLKIVWDREALFQFQDIYDYLKQKSQKAANKVRKSILEEIKDLPSHPEIFPPDKYRLPQNDSYRAFEKYNFRIAYFITKTEIRILVKHTSREPKNY